MRIYYDNSKNGEIFFSILLIIFFIIFLLSNDCPWYILPIMMIIPFIPFFIWFFEKKKYYIMKTDNIIEFTLKNNNKYKTNPIKHLIKEEEILNVIYINKTLTIITINNKYVITPFIDNNYRLEKIFQNVIYEL